MPQACSICIHPARADIDRALVAGEPLRDIAQRTATSKDALARHRAGHIPELLARAKAQQEAHGAALGEQVERQAAAEDVHALNVLEELTRCFRRVNLLFDACDRWLRDADDPTRYDIGPRADNVTVTYTEPGPDGKLVRKKALLSDLLTAVQTSGLIVDHSLMKYADPRELVLKAAGQLKSQTELLAKLLGELQQEGTINLTLSPEWTTLRTALLQALGPYPEARVAAAQALVGLEAAPAAQAGGGSNGHSPR